LRLWIGGHSFGVSGEAVFSADSPPLDRRCGEFSQWVEVNQCSDIYPTQCNAEFDNGLIGRILTKAMMFQQRWLTDAEQN
jgi:hypothetical protein